MERAGASRDLRTIPHGYQGTALPSRPVGNLYHPLRVVGIYLKQLSWNLTEAFLCLVKTILTDNGAKHLDQQQNAFLTPADGRGP